MLCILVKAGVHLKAVFWLGIMVLTQISCSCFKLSKTSQLFPHIYGLGCFVTFLLIFFWVYHIGEKYFFLKDE